MVATYLERVATRGMTVLGFRQEGGGMCRGVYTIANSGPDMFKPAGTGGGILGGAGIIGEILGETTVGTRKMTRQLPLAHPLVPWMYAAEITSITGIGKASTTQAAMTQYPAETITSVTAAYPQYEIAVTFAPRPYALFEDEAIYDHSLTWYNTDDSAVVTQVQEEWQRYIDIEVRPNAEVITGQQGQSYFATSTAALTPVGAAPHGLTFQGFPRIIVRRAQMLVRWFQVPISYVMSPNSFLEEYIGRVNQNTFMGYAPGFLLYEGFTHKRYTPPAPNLGVYDGSVTLDVSKLCDVEMVWSLVKRTQTSVPSFSAINRNWIASGHNLLPWFGNRQFYHAVYPLPSAINTTSGWKPTYESVPFELLFQNPDWV